MKIILRLIGLLAIIFGVAILFWIGYNIFIAWQPEAKGNPIISSTVAILLINVGVIWLQGKTLEVNRIAIPRIMIVVLLVLSCLYEVVRRIKGW